MNTKYRYTCLILEVQSSLYGFNVAGASPFDVCQVGRTVEITFEAAPYIFRNSVFPNFIFDSTRTVDAAQVNMSVRR